MFFQSGYVIVVLIPGEECRRRSEIDKVGGGQSSEREK